MLKFFYIDISHSPQCITRSLTKTRMCAWDRDSGVFCLFVLGWFYFCFFLNKNIVCAAEKGLASVRKNN